MSTDLSIVIVSYNTRDDLLGCLASVREHPPSCPHDIVVVDNGSSDGSPAAVRETFPGTQVIEAGANLGFSRANNVGIRATGGAFVLLLNSDTIVSRGALDRLLDTLRADTTIAAVGPKLVDAESWPELSFGSMIGPFGEAWQKALVVGHARRWPLVTPYVERLTRRPRDVDWVSGACLLVRRADADAVGLLDERYFMYTEDVDLCAALRARGRRVRFVPDAVIVHLRGRSAATARRETAILYRRSRLAFYAKHHPGWVRMLRIYLWFRGVMPDGR